MKDYDASWITNLKDMNPKWGEDDKTRWMKNQQMEEYVRTKSNDSLSLDTLKWHFYQLKPLPWRYVFDLIKLSTPLRDSYCNPMFTILHEWPQNFNPLRPNPESGKMFASYNSRKDAISLMVLTGSCIEHRGDEDGFGEEPDEHEALIGLCNRGGKWIEEPKFTWI